MIFNLSQQPVTLQYGTSLGLIAACAALIIYSSAIITDPVIEHNLYQDQLHSVQQIMPSNLYGDNPFSQASTVMIAGENSTLYKTSNSAQQATGYLIATSVQGYSGAIRLMIALDLQGAILGVEVVSHSETPGLGDKIQRNKSDWLLQFTHKTLRDLSEQQWHVKKDGGSFDQFSGATITPRAIVKQIHATLVALDQGVPNDEQQ